jgi:hypothetical protein
VTMVGSTWLDIFDMLIGVVVDMRSLRCAAELWECEQ